MPLHPTRVISRGPPSGLSSIGEALRPAQDTEWGQGRGRSVYLVRLIQTPLLGFRTQAHGEEKTAQATAGFQDETDFTSSQNVSSNFRELQRT